MLWDALYLTTAEVAELLAYVKEHAAYLWLYPMFAFAAHTGARRSEMLRALVADADFAGNTVLVREKKQSRRQRSTRRVPLTATLKQVQQDCWLSTPVGLSSSATAGPWPAARSGA